MSETESVSSISESLNAMNKWVTNLKRALTQQLEGMQRLSEKYKKNAGGSNDSESTSN